MRLSLRVAQMLLADLDTFCKTNSQGRLLKNANIDDHNLPSPDACPDHDVGELQKVEDVSLLCVRTVLLWRNVNIKHQIITQSH